MALPAFGLIRMGQVRTELGASGQITLGSSAVRDLFGISSGEIQLSDGYGASAGASASNTLQLTSENKSFYVGNEATSFPRGIEFDTFMSKMFIADNDTIYQYNMSTQGALQTASFSQSFTFPETQAVESSTYNIPRFTRTIRFNESASGFTAGTQMYVAGEAADGGGIIRQYDLSTPFDLSTATLNSSKNISQSANDILFDHIDGDYAWFTDSSVIRGYSLSTPYDLTTRSVNNFFTINIPDINGIPVYTYSFDLVGSNKDRLLLTDISNDKLYQFEVNSPYTGRPNDNMLNDPIEVKDLNNAFGIKVHNNDRVFTLNPFNKTVEEYSWNDN